MIDETKLEAFMGQAVSDLGAAISGLMVVSSRKSCGRAWLGVRLPVCDTPGAARA